MAGRREQGKWVASVGGDGTALGTFVAAASLVNLLCQSTRCATPMSYNSLAREIKLWAAVLLI